MLKTITDVNGRTVKMGRRRHLARSPGLRFSDYILRTAKPAPDCDYTKSALGSLDKMYLNDNLGDCVIAWLAHMFGVFNANAGGNQAIFSYWQILRQYMA